MSYTNILTNQKESILEITINRPEKLNAINKITINEIGDAMILAEANPEVVVIILTGSGEKAFVAGADISEFSHFNIEEGNKLASEGQNILFDIVANLNKPVIAAVNGFALGGGLELAMSCHVRIASENARLGLPEVSLGVIPGYGGTQRLGQLAGKGKAMEMILTAGMVDASEAYRIGLVNMIVSQEELMDTCRKMAGKMMRNSPMAMAAAIRSVNAGFKDGVNGFNVEIEEFGKCFGTPEFVEGTTAFLEKRKANFRNLQ